MLGPAALRRWDQVHRWSSLVCTIVLFMLCVTGLPLVFGDEIGHWTGDTVEPPAMAADVPYVSLDRIVADAKARRPSDLISYVGQDDDAPAWFVSMVHHPTDVDAAAVYKYDARTGAMIHDIAQRQGVMYFIRELHTELFMGLPGTLFIGVMGVLFVAAIVSGVVLYAPFMRKLTFGTVRFERARRTSWLDLHNVLGIGVAMWLFVVGVTGAINTLALPAQGYWQATELAEMTAPWRGKPAVLQPTSLQHAVDSARVVAPGMDVGFVAFPGTPFAGPHHYAIFMKGTTPLTSRLFTPVLIDGVTGRVTATRRLPWYLVALLLAQPLHFGDYGGLPLKILWGLFDVVAIVILGSGLYLWFTRRSAGGRGEPIFPDETVGGGAVVAAVITDRDDIAEIRS